MDINFHYFTVKSLAYAAGFNESEAQIIASNSEFIDDYNWYFYKKMSNIPNYVKSENLDLYIGTWYIPANFNPATTGFSDLVDYATLITERSQKFTVSPFHFIPRDFESLTNKNFRTIPATLNNDSYISNMLNEAKGALLTASGQNDRNLALMHIGMLLHTFADTYAHQLFTGYNSWENRVSIVQVINNITGKDQTEHYKSRILTWLDTLSRIVPGFEPFIGHMLIEHIPDLTHLSFTMEYKANKTDSQKSKYGRSNTSEFVRAAKEIFNYLRLCLGKETASSEEWESVAEKIADGFLIDISELSGESAIVNTLIPHWKKCFSGCSYSYSSEEIKKSFITSTSNEAADIITQSNGQEISIFDQSASDNFYRYNVYADEMLIKLYGSHPRKSWFNATTLEESNFNVMAKQETDELLNSPSGSLV